MADAPDPWQMGGIIGGAVTVLTAIGGFVRWFVTRNDTKEAALVAKLETRVRELEARDEKRERELIALRLAFEIVAGVVRRTDPANAELARAEKILSQAFPADLDTPAAMLALLAKLP